jgi:hypothetical protein
MMTTTTTNNRIFFLLITCSKLKTISSSQTLPKYKSIITQLNNNYNNYFQNLIIIERMSILLCVWVLTNDEWFPKPTIHYLFYRHTIRNKDLHIYL